MEYDFSKLNDREFEILAASVIAKEHNIKVEIFKSGRDGGVDGRFWIEDKKERYYTMQTLFRNSLFSVNFKIKKRGIRQSKKVKS